MLVGLLTLVTVSLTITLVTISYKLYRTFQQEIPPAAAPTIQHESFNSLDTIASTVDNVIEASKRYTPVVDDKNEKNDLSLKTTQTPCVMVSDPNCFLSDQKLCFKARPQQKPLETSVSPYNGEMTNRKISQFIGSRLVLEKPQRSVPQIQEKWNFPRRFSAQRERKYLSL